MSMYGKDRKVTLRREEYERGIDFLLKRNER